MKKNFKPTGVCSKNIFIELDDNNVISKVEFEGGCNGNTKGLAKMVEGLDAKDVIKKLKGIKCGLKPTSCPDQLAIALEKAVEN